MLEFVLGYSMGKPPAPPSPSVAASPRDLEKQIHELALIVSAMWSLLERQGMTSDQLIAKLQEFDRIDGVSDNQDRPRVLDCPSCHSKVAFGLQNCQYCGTKVRTESGEPLNQS